MQQVGAAGDAAQVRVAQAVAVVDAHAAEAVGLAHDQLDRGAVPGIGHGLLQAVTVRVRVQAQAVIQPGLHGRNRLGRRTIGVLVGVELDEVVELGLFARHVGGEIADDLAPETTHGI